MESSRSAGQLDSKNTSSLRLINFQRDFNMNFKTLAICAGLVFAANASFAADIDMSASTFVTGVAGNSSGLLGMAEAALAVGATHTQNNAVIYQDVTNGAAEQIAYIDQVGTLGGLAMIAQLGNAAGTVNVAYIQQFATTNARAVITQR